MKTIGYLLAKFFVLLCAVLGFILILNLAQIKLSGFIFYPIGICASFIFSALIDYVGQYERPTKVKE